MLSTAGLMVMAAGLGALAEHPEGEATPATGALLCGGLAACFTVQTVASIMEKAPWRWVLGWQIAYPLVTRRPAPA